MSSAEQIARLYTQRAAQLGPAVTRGIRRAIVAANREASIRTSGSGEAAPGSYPIPIRVGHLNRSGGARMLGDFAGLVFNRAYYANAIHNKGFRAYGNPKAPFYKPRPWLQDAIEHVDPVEIIGAEVRKAVFA